MCGATMFTFEPSRAAGQLSSADNGACRKTLGVCVAVALWDGASVLPSWVVIRQAEPLERASRAVRTSAE